jgi:uncharacterized protein (TIGR03435 family)
MTRVGLFAVLIAIVVWCGVHEATAQNTQPRFEVVSVKENVSGELSGYASMDLTPSRFQSDTPIPSPITLRNIVLCNLIARAYEVGVPLQRYGLFNGLAGGGSCTPGQSGHTGLLARRFDIAAKPPAGSRPADVFAMLRTMLAERFQLQMRREMRLTPVYALTVAQPGRLGPGLKRSELDCLARRLSGERPPAIESNPCLSRMNSAERHINGGGRLTALLNGIQSVTDRFVVDTTGLSGTYEWHYSHAVAPDHPSLPNIYTAVREQLGLRLEPRNMPVEVWVIDHIEQPTPD